MDTRALLKDFGYTVVMMRLLSFFGSREHIFWKFTIAYESSKAYLAYAEYSNSIDLGGTNLENL